MPLTPTQLQALKDDIAANTNTIGGVPIKDLPRSPDNTFAITVWYNQPTAAFYVWRDVSVETILSQISFANMTPADAVPTDTALNVAIWQARSLACQGKQFNLQNMIVGRTVAPMKRSTFRSAMQDALTNLPAGAGGALLGANWTGVRAAAIQLATNAERLFASTASGNGAQATPADVVVEGAISFSDVDSALNLP